MNKIQAISDQKIIQRFQSAIERLVEKPWHLNPDWIANKKWIAVPMEKGRHFEEEEAKTISHALLFFGYTECFAIATEPMGDYPHCYLVPPTKEGLLDFSKECAGLNFILVPENMSFAILCTSENYNIFAGPSDFVEKAIGTNIAAARAKFREVASDEWWEGKLLEIAEKYEKISWK